ncbi:autophagy protein Apg16, putative [Cordyceps militaris CM01]|uniref:Autophagy protein Apg16, putative n=1 Tax=Cordyceps militaris (strain CM01) TaxID=983644 RepID=G3JKY8_CORMM|nr:autophagy protein Apg16, putative [Cordyceps militaris CM01]EGX90362.1 autophagy protein Apg16, putative [Cordyceps militaris CM01]
MPNWREEYLISLRDSEMNTPVNMELVQTCSQMADRISALEAERSSLEAQLASSGKPPQKNAAGGAANSTADTGETAQLRHDLAEALRSKGTTETRLRAAEEELAKLRSKTKEDARSVRSLTADRTALTTRLKDREFELREKRKLVEVTTAVLTFWGSQVQDEMITLNLQVSVAEKERDKVKKENKELVDRWMKRMAQEADAMNLANEPGSR